MFRCSLCRVAADVILVPKLRFPANQRSSLSLQEKSSAPDKFLHPLRSRRPPLKQYTRYRTFQRVTQPWVAALLQLWYYAQTNHHRACAPWRSFATVAHLLAMRPWMPLNADILTRGHSYSCLGKFARTRKDCYSPLKTLIVQWRFGMGNC